MPEHALRSRPDLPILAAAAGLALAGVLAAGPAWAQQAARAAAQREPSGALAGSGFRGLTEDARAPDAPPRAPAAVRPNPTRRDVSRDVTGTVRAPVRATVIQPVATLPPPQEEPPPRRRRPATEDPFAPLGLRLGGVTLLPAIEQGVGYDDNPQRGRGRNAAGSLFTRTDGELRLQSDWVRHDLNGYLRGGYSAYRDASDADRPDAEGRVTYRHDFTRQTQGTIEGRLRVETERPGSPDLTAAVRGRPIIASYGVEAGASHAFNRLSLGLKGAVDRVVYEDAKLSNGATLDQGDRNYTQYGLKLRGAFEASPALQPFVEASLDTRERDDAVDRFGFRRSSAGIGLKAGTKVELTRTLTGEISAGYQLRRYDDARLPDVKGAVADAALVWSVTPLTTARLTLATTLDETTILGSSGAVTNRAGIEVTHDLRRNLALIGGLSFGRTDYRGVNLTEDTTSASVKLDYKIGRSFVLRASYAHERLDSSALGSDYIANVYLLGLRLQR